MYARKAKAELCGGVDSDLYCSSLSRRYLSVPGRCARSCVEAPEGEVADGEAVAAADPLEDPSAASAPGAACEAVLPVDVLIGEQ